MSNPTDGRLELLVKDLVPSDMSNYTCISINKAGSHDKNGTITVNCAYDRHYSNNFELVFKLL